MLSDRLIEECDDCIERLDDLIAINTESIVKEKLTSVWKAYTTRKLAKIFKEYMESLEVNKYNWRKKDNVNVYWADGSSTNWHRVNCCYFKDALSYGNENLEITSRKQAGSYFIIEKKQVRAFECDYSGIVHYEEDLLNEIMEEHKPLFDTLFEGLKKKRMVK